MMNVDNRKAILGFGLAIVLFWGIKKFILDDKKDDVRAYQPEIKDSDIEIALAAYRDALDANEPQAVINDLNIEFADQFGFRIYVRKKDGHYVVTDLSGKEVKVI
jgi:hypothetical protein